MVPLHLTLITANYVPLIVRRVKRVKWLKVSLDFHECLAKCAIGVSAETTASASRINWRLWYLFRLVLA